MKYRKLRIAWSVFWGVACVLLVVLWARSDWYLDQMYCEHSGLRPVLLLAGPAMRIVALTSQVTTKTREPFSSRVAKSWWL